MFDTVYCLLGRAMVRAPVLLLAGAFFAVVSTNNRADTLAPAAMNWHRLELQSSALKGSITTRIELRILPAAGLRSALVDVPKPMSQRQSGTRIGELEVNNSIHLLLGIRFENQSRLWFNGDDGTPLQLLRQRHGRKPSRKLYLFGSSQVYRQRRQPADKAESAQPAGHWSKISESFYPLADTEGACEDILESSQLLYLLSRPDHVPGEVAAELCVFDRQRIYRVGMRLLGREQLAVDYLQVTGSQETRVKRTQQAVRVALTSRPLEGAEGDVEPFSFLGLDDNIELLLSEPERIPLRVHGQVSGFGVIDLELGKLIR